MPSLPTRILGFEPAVIGAALQGIIPLLVFVSWWHISGEQLSLLSTGVAAVVAAYVALSTQHATLAVVLGVFQAGIAIATGFGAGISNEQQAAIIGGVGVFFGILNRTQTTPIAKVKAAAALGVEYGQTVLGEPIRMTVTNSGGILGSHQPSNVQLRDAKGHFAKKGSVPPEHNVS